MPRSRKEMLEKAKEVSQLLEDLLDGIKEVSANFEEYSDAIRKEVERLEEIAGLMSDAEIERMHHVLETSYYIAQSIKTHFEALRTTFNWLTEYLRKDFTQK